MTYHATDRGLERIEPTLGRHSGLAAIERAERYARLTPAGVDVALRVFHDTAASLYAGASNGDTIVAIIRNRKVVTYMLRRSTQVFTPEAFRVHRVDYAED